MQRRKFCQYAALSTVCLAKSIGSALAITSKAKLYHPWVVLYWMPYDNDLSRFGEPIVEMLTRGTQNSSAAVAVQLDYWGNTPMRRRQIIDGVVTEIDVSGEDSSNVSAFEAYLDWTYQTFQADHWAVIVVGHGGRINEISPDDHRANHQTRAWMGVDQFTNTVSNFNQATDGRVELLYFQNCNKATLEVVYEAKNSARYTLASQLTLGAPNYYYEGFLNRLASLTDGHEAALTIMDTERDDMYFTLTLIDNQAVEHIPEKLSNIFQAILSNKIERISWSNIPTYSYFGERHCDLLVFLNHIATASNTAQHELLKFINFLNSSVILSHRKGGTLFGTHPRAHTASQELCGLSLFFPENEQDISRYSTLALYQEVDLVSLYRAVSSVLLTR